MMSYAEIGQTICELEKALTVKKVLAVDKDEIFTLWDALSVLNQLKISLELYTDPEKAGPDHIAGP